MINEIIHKATVMDNDTLYLTDNKLDKIITQTRKKIKITPKNKNKYRNKTMTMINNKKNLINKINIRLSKAKTKVSNNIKSIYKALSKLQDDDSWLRVVELNNIDTILDDALNVVWYEIYGKNRKSSKIINIDTHKDIDGSVSKLTIIINNKLKLLNVMNMGIGRVMCNIKNKTNTVNEKIRKASVMDNDTLYLIDDNLNEIITYLIKGLKKKKKKINSGSGLPDPLSQDFGGILMVKISER